MQKCEWRGGEERGGHEARTSAFCCSCSGFCLERRPCCRRSWRENSSTEASEDCKHVSEENATRARSAALSWALKRCGCHARGTASIASTSDDDAIFGSGSCGASASFVDSFSRLMRVNIDMDFGDCISIRRAAVCDGLVARTTTTLERGVFLHANQLKPELSTRPPPPDGPVSALVFGGNVTTNFRS